MEAIEANYIYNKSDTYAHILTLIKNNLPFFSYTVIINFKEYVLSFSYYLGGIAYVYTISSF